MKLFVRILIQDIFQPIVPIKNLYKLNLVELAYGGLVLGWSQFLQPLQLPQKITLTSIVAQSY